MAALANQPARLKCAFPLLFAADAALGENDRGMFERLRVLRKTLADRANVPAYIVFSDKVLREMAVRRPADSGQLLDVPGVGPAKLERYGGAFLGVLNGGVG